MRYLIVVSLAAATLFSACDSSSDQAPVITDSVEKPAGAGTPENAGASETQKVGAAEQGGPASDEAAAQLKNAVSQEPGTPVAAAADKTNTSEPGAAWQDHTQGFQFSTNPIEALTSKPSDKPTLFYVTAQWCQGSKDLAQESFVDEEVRQLLGSFHCVLVDASETPDWSGRFATDGIPHFDVRSASGERVKNFGGVLGKEELKKALESALSASSLASH